MKQESVREMITLKSDVSGSKILAKENRFESCGSFAIIINLAFRNKTHLLIGNS